MIKQLKKLHHRYLVWKMLKKQKSLFGNEIYKPIGQCEQQLTLTKENSASVAVVVITHNNKAIIGKCVNALIKYNDYDYEIIVVDNQSNDGTFELLKSIYSDQIVLLKNRVNGCASGRNLGAKNTKAEFILFLDSDQGPTKNRWLDSYISIINQYKNVGAVGWHGGFITEPDLTGPSLSHYPHKGIPEKFIFRTNVDYLETGGLLVKRDVFDKVGGFDTIFDPFTFADVDFSRKIVAHGYDLAYSPTLSIYHIPHSTTKADRPDEKYLSQFGKNAAIFRKKWLD